MKLRHQFNICLTAVAIVGYGMGSISTAQQPLDQFGGTVEILTRGPVHEAFAGAVTFDPQPAVLVPKAPPDAIEELPPELKPEGDNAEWIPGYWAWDDKGSDFIWVSGTWRNLPPGRQWIPGYWGQSANAAQWTSGYWADSGLTEVEYLPEPPESVESGPNIEAPSENSIWLPGNWVWQQNRYAWRPGFWSGAQPNWIWTPAHYLWAPRGYVFVDGYWDYNIANRGVLFAPVRFNQKVFVQQGFNYSPATVINARGLINHLFLRPNYGHYYYGDYYGANYAASGFYPSHSFYSGRQGYDPIYVQQRWENRRISDWERRVQENFERRRNDESTRPPRTFAAQQELVQKGLSEEEKAERVFSSPLKQFAESSLAEPLRFQPVSREDRQRFGHTGVQIRTQREQRQQLETRLDRPTATQPDQLAATEESALSRIKLPRSPLVAKDAKQLGKEFVPPKRQQFPATDNSIIPKPRRQGDRTIVPKPDVVTAAAEVKPRPDRRPDPKPESKPELKPNTKPDPKPEPEPDPKSGEKLDPRG